MRPGGWTDEMTGRASTEVDPVGWPMRPSDMVERIGISDFVRDDGLADPLSSFHVERVDVQHAGSGFRLAITDPKDDVTRKQATTWHHRIADPDGRLRR